MRSLSTSTCILSSAQAKAGTENCQLHLKPSFQWCHGGWTYLSTLGRESVHELEDCSTKHITQWTGWAGAVTSQTIQIIVNTLIGPLLLFFPTYQTRYSSKFIKGDESVLKSHYKPWFSLEGWQSICSTWQAKEGGLLFLKHTRLYTWRWSRYFLTPAAVKNVLRKTGTFSLWDSSDFSTEVLQECLKMKK